MSITIPEKTGRCVGPCPLSFGGTPSLDIISSALSSCFWKYSLTVLSRTVEKEIVDQPSGDPDTVFM